MWIVIDYVVNGAVEYYDGNGKGKRWGIHVLYDTETLEFYPRKQPALQVWILGSGGGIYTRSGRPWKLMGWW